MNILVYLVPMAIGLGLTGLFAFLWALRAGQFDDPQGAAVRVLSDEDVQGLVDAAGSKTSAAPSWPGCC